MWRYKWLHIPTKTEGFEQTDDFVSRQQFLEAIAKWNELGFGLWQYSEA